MRRVIAFSVLVLAGCALTPAEVRDQGEKSTHSTSAAPIPTASCLVRNAENMSQIATMKPGTTPDSQEVVVRVAPNGTLFTTAVAVVTPNSVGATVTLFLAPIIADKDGFRAKLLNGC